MVQIGLRLFRQITLANTSVTASMQTLLMNMGVVLLNMLTGMLIARGLGADGRGVHAAILLWPQFLAFLLNMGIHSAALYESKRQQPGKDLFTGALLLSSGASCAAMGIGYVLLPMILHHYDSATIRYAQYMLFVIPMLHLSFLVQAMLRSMNRFGLYNLTRISVPLLTAIGLGLCLWLDAFRPSYTVLSYFLPYAPIFLYLGYRMYRQLPGTLRGLRASIRKLTSYGMRCSGHEMLGTASLYADQLLVAFLLSPSALGLYVVAVSLARMVNIFSNSIIMVLFPKASGLAKAEVVRMTLTAFRLNVLVMLVGGSVIILLAPWFLSLLYGADFAGAVTVFRLLVLEVMLTESGMVLAQAFMALNLPGRVSWLQAIGFGTSLPLMWWWIQGYGIHGAALGLLCAAVVKWLYLIVQYRRCFGVGLKQYGFQKEDYVAVKRLLRKYRVKGVSS
ncbi:lipopolysaccharide biosynthesis protein [Marinicrinis sediminis]|uniref:Lipopolysaccharide biosynthesis protein n=1 Tax=Marinicrinis sediminis TaxID=1652465 RepID=A0ABW5RD19_9BACL